MVAKASGAWRVYFYFFLIDLQPVSGEIFWHMIEQNLSVSKSSRLHAVIFWFFFLDYYDTHSIDSFKMIGNFPEVLQ